MKRTKRGPLIESAEKQRKMPSNFAQAEKMVGWSLQRHACIDVIEPPTAHELNILRALQQRTQAAHQTRVFPS